MGTDYFALGDPDPDTATGVLRITRAPDSLATDVYRPDVGWAFTGDGLQYISGDLESWPITEGQAHRIVARIDATLTASPV